jgi:ParB family chromosome partitioning protein
MANQNFFPHHTNGLLHMSNESAVLEGELETTAENLHVEETQAFEKAVSRTARIPLSLIRKSDVALRDEQRNSEQYALLLQSVKKSGVMNSITVREQEDPMTKEKVYGLIDGLQRFTASIDAGLMDIPANIVAMDDAEVLEAQLITNMNRVETKPVDQSKHLLRILARNAFLTKQELANRICQSITWLEQRLGLSHLRKEVAELVNAGKINLTNAYSLSKLEEDEQINHLEAAMTESPKTFVPRMKQRAKEIRDARKKGDDPTRGEFQPVMFMHKMSDLKTELEQGCPIGIALLEKLGINTPSEAFKLALEWVLHYDSVSREEQSRANEVKVAQRKEAAEKAKAEREQKKQEDAARAKEDLTKGW